MPATLPMRTIILATLVDFDIFMPQHPDRSARSGNSEARPGHGDSRTGNEDSPCRQRDFRSGYRNARPGIRNARLGQTESLLAHRNAWRGNSGADAALRDSRNGHRGAGERQDGSLTTDRLRDRAKRAPPELCVSLLRGRVRGSPPLLRFPSEPVAPRAALDRAGYGPGKDLQISCTGCSSRSARCFYLRRPPAPPPRSPKLLKTLA